MTRSIDRIRAALVAKGAKITSDRGDQFRATTVCHGGDGPNLSVRQIGDRATVFCHSRGCTYPEVMAALDLPQTAGFDNEGSQTYTYRHPDGRPAYDVTRHVTATSSKRFTNGKGQAGPDGKHLIYRVGEVVAAVKAGATVYVCEGEKDADSVAGVGGVATTSGGSSTAASADWSPLYGAAHVIIVPDQDAAGEKYAATVTAALADHVTALEVRAPIEGNDVTDHLTAGHTLDQLARVGTPELGDGFAVVPFADVKIRRQLWLWADRIPMDTLTVLAGRGGEGKSTFALHLAARLTRGELEGEHYGTPRNVLVWESEDDPGAVVAPRLMAAGADMGRVFNMPHMTEAGTPRAPRFPDDVGALERAIRAQDAALVILSPVLSTVAGNQHRADEVRRTFDPLARVAQDTGAVILGIAHLRKGGGAGGDMLSGSHAIRDTVRSLFLLATDEDSGAKIITQEKNNYAASEAASLAFHIRDAELITTDGDTIHVGQVTDLHPTDVNAGDVLNRRGEDAEDRAERTEAQQWLIDYLAPLPGCEALRVDILKAARAAGFSQDQMKRARAREPRVTAARRDQFQGGSVWMLDAGPDPLPASHGAPTSAFGAFGAFGADGATPAPDAPEAVETYSAPNPRPAPNALNAPIALNAPDAAPADLPPAIRAAAQRAGALDSAALDTGEVA